MSNQSGKAEPQVRHGLAKLHEHVWVDPVEIIAIYGDGRPDGDAVVQLTSGRSVIVPDSTATEVMDTLDSIWDATQKAHESQNS